MPEFRYRNTDGKGVSKVARLDRESSSEVIIPFSLVVGSLKPPFWFTATCFGGQVTCNCYGGCLGHSIRLIPFKLSLQTPSFLHRSFSTINTRFQVFFIRTNSKCFGSENEFGPKRSECFGSENEPGLTRGDITFWRKSSPEEKTYCTRNGCITLGFGIDCSQY